MKTRIFLHGFNLALCGLAVAAFVACGDDSDGGGGAGGTGGAGSTTTTGTADPSTTTTGATDPSTTTTTAATTTASTGGNDVSVPEDLESIDDMEDGDGTLDQLGGRVGYWYSYNDGTGTQTPAVSTEDAPVDFTPEDITPPRGQSTKAVHTKGSGFTGYGAGVGFDLSSAETGKQAYDASAYKGIVFWAKLGSAGAAASMSFTISDKTSDPAGGICDEAAAEDAEDKCFDHWAYTVQIGADWAPVVIPFEDLARGGWGAEPTATGLDLAGVYSIQFQFASGADFDVWIDDISFFK
jgi:hypothetical protein